MMPYERLNAWRVTHELALQVCQLSQAWPNPGPGGLTPQIQRAALSAPSNIAEGAAKRTSREYRRYLDIAVGSLGELSYLLRVARDLGLLSDEEWVTTEELRTRAGQLTWRLYESIGKKIRDGTERK